MKNIKWIIQPFLLVCLPLVSSADVKFSETCASSKPLTTISFVGDILIHKMLYQHVVDSTGRFSSIWEKTDPLIRKADFSVGNLEGPTALGIDKNGRDRGDVGFIYDDDVYSGTNFKFNFHPRILENLKDSGYDLISLSNNHTLDRYSIGVDRTLEASRRVGLPIVGIRHSQDRSAPLYRIERIQDLRIAFVSCTEHTNGKKDRNEQLLLCYQQEKEVLSIVQQLSKRSDVDGVIVMPHWGSEYKHKPNSSQKSLARKLVEAGAIAVVGSHPHVLQPWEKYVSKGGREAIVMYSLGNFVAGQKYTARKTGVVAYIGLQKGSDGKAQLVGSAYTPTYRDGYQVSPVGRRGSKTVLKHAAQFFGEKQRVDTSEPIRSKLCLK